MVREGTSHRMHGVQREEAGKTRLYLQQTNCKGKGERVRERERWKGNL